MICPGKRKSWVKPPSLTCSFSSAEDLSREKKERGQATLPDLFFFFSCPGKSGGKPLFLTCSFLQLGICPGKRKSGGKPPFLTCSFSSAEDLSRKERGQATLPDLFFFFISGSVQGKERAGAGHPS